MGSLHEALAVWRPPSALGRPLHLTTLEQAHLKVKQILDSFQPTLPSEADLAAAYRKLRLVADNEQSFSRLSRRDLRNGIWTLFREFDDRLPPLFESAEFFRNFVENLASRRSARPIRSLVLSFLENYPRSSALFARTCQEISGALNQSHDPRIETFKTQVASFRLLQENGPTEFAVRIIHGDIAVQDLLVAAYLTEIRGQLGFIEAAHSEVCRIVKRGLLEGRLEARGVSRVLEFMSADDSNREIRIKAARERVAGALLLPFANQQPPEAAKELIKNFLLDRFGDPRIHRAKWHTVPQDCRAVLIRWLVQDTFRDFFNIVDLTQQSDSDADRQWPYRRAFWTAYFKKDVVNDAWLVLGRDIAQRARRELGIDAESYGKLSGAKHSHAVLILKIRDYLIVEWSHVGSYRLWQEANPSSPRLYLPAYDRTALVMRPDVEGSHHAAEHGTWQGKLANIIRGRTGISITRLEYMDGL